MTFTYDVTVDRGKVRLLLADTSAASYVFEDEEIDAFLSMNSNDVTLAAVQGLRVIAASKARIAIWYQVNGLTLDRRGIAKGILDAAKALEEAASSAPFEFESVLEHLIDSSGRDMTNYMDTPGTP